MATPKRFTRIEVRDDVIANSGTLQTDGQGPRDLIRNARTVWELHRTPVLTFDADPTAAIASALTHDNVVVTYFDDGDFDEYRIVRLDRIRPERGEMSLSVMAHGIRGDLRSASDTIELVQADGSVFHRFPARGVSPSDHLTNFILPALPGYFSEGTMDFTDPVDITYSFDTAQSALEELVKQLTGPNTNEAAELDVRRNGTTDYKIDILEKVNGSATKVWIRKGIDQRAIRQTEDGTKIGNRFYPVGAQGVHMGDHMFGGTVDAVDRTEIVLDDDPVWQDDVLNSYQAQLFLRTLVSGSSPETFKWTTSVEIQNITDSSAPDTIFVDTGVGASSNAEYVRIVRNGDGDRLTFLEDDSSAIPHSTLIKREDILPIVNFVRNPLGRTKTGGSPDNWATIGSPTETETTDTDFWQHGGRSWKYVASEDEGVTSGNFPVHPTATRPHYSAMVNLYVESGVVRVELEDFTNTKVYPPPSSEQSSVTQGTGAWFNMLIDPQQVDFQAEGTATMAINVTAHNGAATFYLDAFHCGNTVGGAQQFIEGGYGRRLWKAAQRRIEAGETSAEVRVDASAIDYQRLDTDLARAPMLVGADIGFRDSELGISSDERIQRVERDLHVEGDLRVSV